MTIALYYLFLIYTTSMLLAPWWWVFDNFVQFVPQFLMVGTIVMLLLLIKRQYLKLVAVALIAFYFGWPLFSLFYSASAENFYLATPENRVLVMQSNVNRENNTPGLFLSVVSERKPTIIALNEVSDAWFSGVRSALHEQYPYYVDATSSDHRGMAILSRIPIASSEIIIFSETTAPVIKATFDEPSFTLFAAHALSPVSRAWAAERDAFIDFVGDQVGVVFGPVVVAGDFNITIHSPQLRNFLLASRLHDAREGHGWNPTWLADTIFAVAIDHIFYGDGIAAESFRTLPSIGSDHRPILASLVITE